MRLIKRGETGKPLSLVEIAFGHSIRWALSLSRIRPTISTMAQNEDHPVLNFLKTYSLNIILVLVMVGLGIWMSILIATSDGKSPKEGAYQAMVLTIASVIASLIVTKMYAQQGYGQNLRDHGVQIAGGIIVLKRQIEVLSEWVASKRNHMRAGTHIPEVTDAVLEHIEQTLSGFRGMTDAALGGIAGVIGDALAQYESVMEQVSRMRLDALHQTREIEQKIETAVSPAEIGVLQAQIQEIALKTERDIAQLARKSAIPIPEQPKRLAEEVPLARPFSCPCPGCSKDNSIQMPNRAGETRTMNCAYCGAVYNVHVLPGGRVIARLPGQVRAVPAGKTAFQGSVLHRLRETQAYVDSGELAIVIKRILAEDAAQRAAHNQPSPRQLQELLFGALDSGDLKSATRKTVRIVFKLLFTGRAFVFPPGSPASFSTAFVNSLKENDLYEVFARSCLYRLRGEIELRPDTAEELAQVLLPEQLPDRRAILERALANIPPLAGGVGSV